MRCIRDARSVLTFKEILFVLRLPLLVSILGCSLAPPPNAGPSIFINFCVLEVPDVVQRGNASFNVVYIFEVDEQGKPIKIVRVRDRHVGIENVRACLRRWRLPHTETGKPIVAILRWEHGHGFASLTVQGPDTQIRLCKGPCSDCCPVRRVHSQNSG